MRGRGEWPPGGEGQDRCNIVVTSVHFVTVSGYLEGSVSRNKDVLTQLSPSSRAILTHFTFLHFAASFAASFAPLCPCLTSRPGVWSSVLLTYSPPLDLRNFRYSDILGIISADRRVRLTRYIVEFKIIRRFRRCLLSQEREGAYLYSFISLGVTTNLEEDKSESRGRVTMNHHHYQYLLQSHAMMISFNIYTCRL